MSATSNSATELKAETIRTRIWEEEAEADNPFTAARSFCRGYDVYGDLLDRVDYIDYLYLLFKGERPTSAQSRALRILAVALANPGPRDPSVHAAMAAGVGDSTAASALMAALAVGAGAGGGARELYMAMQAWLQGSDDTPSRLARLIRHHQSTRLEVWPEIDRPPGFAAYGSTCALPVRQTLDSLVQALPDGAISWLQQQRQALETAAGRPLAMMGVAAAALIDLGFAPSHGEMLCLLLRLPGAAAHALEQQDQGFRHFPFFALELENDPDRAVSQVKEAA